MAVTSPVAKLQKGSRTLDIASGRYKIAADFVPPSVARVAQFAAGGALVGERAVNREFGFGVHLSGSSEQELRRALTDIQTFLNLAGDEAEPLYLVTSPHSDAGFEPLWGQQYYRYEIAHGTAQFSQMYSWTDMRSRSLPGCRVSLTIRPFARGIAQRLGRATGGVLEDTIGTVDGISRGTIIPEATTNKMTNPIFGHSTWNNGWTASLLSASAENTDPDFVLFGESSAKLTGLSTSDPSIFYQSIDVTNTNAHELSAYVKQEDGSALTASEVKLYYGTGVGGAITPDSFISVGNGWYRMVASVTGVASATKTGIEVEGYNTVYVDGVQIEEKAYATPLAHGDMLGCAWSGTDHASTTDRTAAQLAIPTDDCWNIGEGSIRVVWKAPVANTDYSANAMLFRDPTSAFRGYFGQAADDWRLNDGTNEIDSAADTFSAGDVIILHFVWKPGSLKVYKAGAEVATGSTYTPPTIGTMLDLGENGTAWANGTFMDFTTWPRAMTATEVTDDYNNVVQLTNDDQRVGSIPYLWTKDGDDVVDNCDDSTRDNWAVCAGIPGSVEAETRFDLLKSGITSPKVWLSLLDMEKFSDPENLTFFNQTDSAEVGACGDTMRQTTVSTTSTEIGHGGNGAFRNLEYKHIAGREFYLFYSLDDAGSNLSAYFRYYYTSSTVSVETDFKALTTGTPYRGYLAGPLVLLDEAGLLLDSNKLADLVIELFGKRSSGSAIVKIDFIMIMVRPLAELQAGTREIIEGRTELGYDGADQIQELYNLTGDIIELIPDRINLLYSILLAGTTDDVDLADTMTYQSIYVTPRYSLL